MFEKMHLMPFPELDSRLEHLVIDARSEHYQPIRNVLSRMEERVKTPLHFQEKNPEEQVRQVIALSASLVESFIQQMYTKPEYALFQKTLPTEPNGPSPIGSLFLYGIASHYTHHPFMKGVHDQLEFYQSFFQTLFTLQSLRILEEKQPEKNMHYLSEIVKFHDFFNENEQEVHKEMMKTILFAMTSIPDDTVKN